MEEKDQSLFCTVEFENYEESCVEVGSISIFERIDYLPLAHDGRGARLIPTDVAGAAIGRRDDVLDQDTAGRQTPGTCRAL